MYIFVSRLVPSGYAYILYDDIFIEFVFQFLISFYDSLFHISCNFKASILSLELKASYQ